MCQDIIGLVNLLEEGIEIEGHAARLCTQEGLDVDLGSSMSVLLAYVLADLIAGYVLNNAISCNQDRWQIGIVCSARS